MHRAVLVLSIAVAALVPSLAEAQVTDPVFVRAQQMVTAGQDSEGRAVVDSVVAATAEGTLRYAEALFWRATLSRTAAAAERDYRRISVEYPLSPRAPEALLRLVQLEMTRGDRVSARAHLERLQREHPTGATSTRASITLAQMAFDDGDVVAGCAAVRAARGGLAPGDIELRNQLDYYSPRCANVAAGDTAGTRTDSVASGPATASTAPTDGPAAGRGRESRATPDAMRGSEFSVQVAAYDTRASAEALAKRLSSRGYAARVVGERKPYRVRVGRYPTRARAAAAMRQMGRANVRGVVVEAEPR